MKDGKFITMGIETSCDESAVGIVADGRTLLSNVISSQIDIHTKFGGVVPEIASRKHLENINFVTRRAMEDAGVKPEDIDLIGVTNGPGLIGALVIGVAHAKGLAFAWDKPLVSVHHIHGHIAANYIEHPDLEPPFLALIVSGGHTNLVMVDGYNSCKVLGETRDDAIGEAYDKVARVVGLGYPGGPKMDKAAMEGDENKAYFKRVYLEKGSYDFSFSGLKTQVLNYINQERMAGREVNPADIAAGFQSAVMEVIADKTSLALKEQGARRLAVAGGVAANSRLRRDLAACAEAAGARLFIPSPVLCTDNGAMIASAAYYKYRDHGAEALDMDAYAGIPL